MLDEPDPLCFRQQEETNGGERVTRCAPRSGRELPSRSTCGPTGAVKYRTKENWTPKTEWEKILARSLFHQEDLLDTKVLRYAAAPTRLAPGCLADQKAIFATGDVLQPRAQSSTRPLPRCPVKVLDAPGIVDDFYMHPIDWSIRDVIVIALGGAAYLFSVRSCAVQRLLHFKEGDLTTVRWTGSGRHVAAGTTTGQVLLWDAEACQQVRCISSHSRRIGSLAWYGPMLSTGGADAEIHQHDVRIRESCILRRQGAHKDLVCGLDYSLDGRLASGGNDNTVCIWEDLSDARPIHKLSEHRAAVKALHWCPFRRNILATGGGMADPKVCLWNTSLGKLRNSYVTDSQVTSLLWGQSDLGLLTAHGYSKNQVSLWRYPSLTKEGDLQGHAGRLLGIAQSPDGSLLCSAAADETLRFWKLSSPPIQRLAAPALELRAIR